VPAARGGACNAEHIHCEAEKKEPIFMCVYLFNACEKLVNFFTDINENFKLQFRVFNFWHAFRILRNRNNEIGTTLWVKNGAIDTHGHNSVKS